MKSIRKLAAVLLAAGIFVTGNGITVLPAAAATNVTLSPSDRYEINGGVFEGWGSSLCWWANRVGYSDSLAQKCADLFYGEDGLHLNIARFNIGGGDDPTHHHITRTDSNMPGYTVYQNGQVTYDWNADANQQNVLRRCIEAAGDDMIVEMFSNSPPYYMTNSGCSTGNKNAGQNNLKDDCYDDFAEYLAEVCAHFQNEWGIPVQSIDPMNEPCTDYWGAFSAKQEGCHFDSGNSESKIITELQKSLKKRNLDNIILCACDETSIDLQIDTYKKLSTDAKLALSRIDTHSYGGSRRGELKNLALTEGKNLWMSEVDGRNTAGTNAGNMGAALWLADRITTDCNGLNASAWILWQLIDNHVSSVGYNGNKDSGMPNINDGFWGVAVADHDQNKVVLSKKYYGFGQFTRYIRPGMIMLNSSNRSLAAFDKENNQLVVVVYNLGGGNADYAFDLSGFSEVGTSAKGIRTSSSEDWKDIGTTALQGKRLNVTLPANSITTYIIDGVKGETERANRIDISKARLTGTDSWQSQSDYSYEKAFDGNRGSFFDGVSNGWVQADLGEVYDITTIGYCPRMGYEYRCADAMFQVSDDGTNWKTVYTISGEPSYGMHYVMPSTAATGRYIRYAVPDGKPNNGVNKESTYCCNIAEIEFYGTPSVMMDYQKISIDAANVTGSEAWHQTANDAKKAFDGSTASFFDGVGDGWVQADLGGMYQLQAIGYCPREGKEYRCTDGMFMVSADGTNWETVHTITTVPGYGMQYVPLEGVTARYIKYAVPSGAPQNTVNGDDVYCCNIAEIEVYGTETTNTRGDVNIDGKVDTADAVMLAKYLSCQGDIANWEAGDLNGDRVLNAVDLTMLKRILMK